MRRTVKAYAPVLIASALCIALGGIEASAQEAAPAAVFPAAAPPMPQSGPQGGTVEVSPVSPATPDAPVVPASEAAAQPPPAPNGAPEATGQAAQAEQLPDACFAHPAKLPAAEVDEFLAKPEQIFAQYGGGGMALSNRVRSLAGSDKRTLEPLIRLAGAANAEQKAMIGAGLGRAAFACSRVAPAYAALIQAVMAGANSPELLTAFLSATNDIQTAALGTGGAGGGASGAGGLSGGGVAGPGSAGLGGDEVVPTTAQTFSIAGGGGFVTSSDDSVSPANGD